MPTAMLWPDVHREDGHWLPAVSLAKSLKDSGLQVRMMGIPDTEAVVAPYKVPFTTILKEIFPLGHALERLETGRNELTHLMPIARGELDSVFTSDGRPDVLIAGYFAALEALILYHKYKKHNLRLVTLTTFLRHPDATPALFAKSTLVHMAPAVVAKLFSLATGKDSMDIDEFIEPLRTAPELIPMPQEFDFKHSDWKHPKHVAYVEPMVKRAPLDGSSLPTPEGDYFHPLPKTGKLIYGACGSQVEIFESSARQFFVNLIEMMNGPGMKSRHLVLSLGVKLYPEFRRIYTADGAGGTRRLPENVSLASWVPQPEILDRSEAVFLHGGLATVKEAIWAGVPLVVVPMVNDQFDNALRIEERELGVMVELDRLSGDRLREALVEVTSSPWIRRSAEQMRQLFLAAENRTPKLSVKIIQDVVQQ